MCGEGKKVKQNMSVLGFSKLRKKTNSCVMKKNDLKNKRLTYFNLLILSGEVPATIMSASTCLELTQSLFTLLTMNFTRNLPQQLPGKPLVSPFSPFLDLSAGAVEVFN
jgi:hypothetical protein